MKTTSAQPILMLKLNEGKHEWFETWTMQYLGRQGGFEEECMDGEVIGSDA